eukprot:gene10314-8245_t
MASGTPEASDHEMAMEPDSPLELRLRQLEDQAMRILEEIGEIRRAQQLPGQATPDDKSCDQALALAQRPQVPDSSPSPSLGKISAISLQSTYEPIMSPKVSAESGDASQPSSLNKMATSDFVSARSMQTNARLGVANEQDTVEKARRLSLEYGMALTQYADAVSMQNTPGDVSMQDVRNTPGRLQDQDCATSKNCVHEEGLRLSNEVEHSKKPPKCASEQGVDAGMQTVAKPPQQVAGGSPSPRQSTERSAGSSAKVALPILSPAATSMMTSPEVSLRKGVMEPSHAAAVSEARQLVFCSPSSPTTVDGMSPTGPDTAYTLSPAETFFFTPGGPAVRQLLQSPQGDGESNAGQGGVAPIVWHSNETMQLDDEVSKARRCLGSSLSPVPEKEQQPNREAGVSTHAQPEVDAGKSLREAGEEEMETKHQLAAVLGLDESPLPSRPCAPVFGSFNTDPEQLEGCTPGLDGTAFTEPRKPSEESFINSCLTPPDSRRLTDPLAAARPKCVSRDSRHLASAPTTPERGTTAPEATVAGVECSGSPSGTASPMSVSRGYLTSAPATPELGTTTPEAAVADSSVILGSAGCGSMMFERGPTPASMSVSRVTNLSQVSKVFDLTPISSFPSNLLDSTSPESAHGSPSSGPVAEATPTSQANSLPAQAEPVTDERHTASSLPAQSEPPAPGSHAARSPSSSPTSVVKQLNVALGLSPVSTMRPNNTRLNDELGLSPVSPMGPNTRHLNADLGLSLISTLRPNNKHLNADLDLSPVGSGDLAGQAVFYSRSDGVEDNGSPARPHAGRHSELQWTTNQSAVTPKRGQASKGLPTDMSKTLAQDGAGGQVKWSSGLESPETKPQQAQKATTSPLLPQQDEMGGQIKWFSGVDASKQVDVGLSQHSPLGRLRHSSGPNDDGVHGAPDSATSTGAASSILSFSFERDAALSDSDQGGPAIHQDATEPHGMSPPHTMASSPMDLDKPARQELSHTIIPSYPHVLPQPAGTAIHQDATEPHDISPPPTMASSPMDLDTPFKQELSHTRDAHVANLTGLAIQLEGRLVSKSETRDAHVANLTPVAIQLEGSMVSESECDSCAFLTPVHAGGAPSCGHRQQPLSPLELLETACSTLAESATAADTAPATTGLTGTAHAMAGLAAADQQPSGPSATAAPSSSAGAGGDGAGAGGGSTGAGDGSAGEGSWCSQSTGQGSSVVSDAAMATPSSLNHMPSSPLTPSLSGQPTSKQPAQDDDHNHLSRRSSQPSTIQASGLTAADQSSAIKQVGGAYMSEEAVPATVADRKAVLATATDHNTDIMGLEEGCGESDPHEPYLVSPGAPQENASSAENSAASMNKTMARRANPPTATTDRAQDSKAKPLGPRAKPTHSASPAMSQRQSFHKTKPTDSASPAMSPHHKTKPTNGAKPISPPQITSADKTKPTNGAKASSPPQFLPVTSADKTKPTNGGKPFGGRVNVEAKQEVKVVAKREVKVVAKQDGKVVPQRSSPLGGQPKAVHGVHSGRVVQPKAEQGVRSTGKAEISPSQRVRVKGGAACSPLQAASSGSGRSSATVGSVGNDRNAERDQVQA